MEIRSALMAAFVASLGLACGSSADDTSGNGGGEGDTDTDSDTDADSDADTDVGWHADTLAFGLFFGWDATKGQVTAASATGKPLPNAAWVMLFNDADMEKGSWTQFCTLYYELDDTAATDARFGSYWMGFDLAALAPEVGADTDQGPGDCDGLGSFIDVTRGVGQPVDEFVAALGFGLGVGSWDLVDYETEEAWKEYWEKHDLAADYGEWKDLQPYFALAGFTSTVKTLGAVDVPKPFGVSYAYELKKGEVTMKGDQGVVLDVSTASSAPSAYFQTQALYIYGTGF